MRNDIEYSVMDIDDADLSELKDQNNDIKEIITHDIAKPLLSDRKYDIIISKSIWEHVLDIEAFHKNIRVLRKTEGHALYFFSCLGTLPFITNRILPKSSSSSLLNTISKRETEKYPAHYKWCAGYSEKYRENWRDGLPYSCASWIFCYNYYKKNLIALDLLERIKSKLLIAVPISKQCSNAMTVQ